MAPRQRFIWPSLWTDPALGRLKPDALLLYVGCFSNADDEGRLLGDAAYLRSTVFPYQDFTLKKVEQLRDAVCAASKSLTHYTVDGVEYLAFSNWGDFQRPKYPKPSTLPAPPGGKASPKLPPKVEESSAKPVAKKEKPSSDPAPRVGLGRDGLVSTAEQSLSVVRPAALPDESLEELGQRLEAATEASNGRAPYGSVDSVFEVIDKPASNTRRELEKWLPMLPPQLVEHVREQTLACEPRKSKAAYAVGTAQRLARERGAA